MRFTPRFLPRNSTGYLLPFLSLFFLGALIAHSQDAPKPTPHVSYDGPALTFDFPGIMIGAAEYEEGPTGTTVLYFPKPVVAAVDVRGGAPGTVNTDVLRLAYDQPTLNAIVLSGGSSYGLSAATGVANAQKGPSTGCAARPAERESNRDPSSTTGQRRGTESEMLQPGNSATD
jgi:hypothetical protein